MTILVLTYSFNIIDWILAEITKKKKEKRKMNTKVRKPITCHRMHYLKADKECVYIKRENGGKGLIQLEFTNKTTD